MTLRTDDELDEVLGELAREEGTSKQEVARRAILDRYRRRGHHSRVEASTASMIDRWAGVLDRLSAT
jgi:predicted transcriptional regulator